MKKRLIFLIIVILIIGGFFAYRFFFSPSYQLEEGKYVIEKDIGKINFEKSGQVRDCLSSKIDSRCNTIQGIYSVSEEEKYNIWVEFPVKFDRRYGSDITSNITKGMFVSAVQDRYEGAEEKINSENTYYFYKDGQSVRVMWVSEGDKILRITTNDFSSDKESNLNLLLNVYLKIYPSSL